MPHGRRAEHDFGRSRQARPTTRKAGGVEANQDARHRLRLACVAIFAVAKSFEAPWPWLSFVAAFAEAATIGGLADWYAVVALFQRPLGLPIPHTAIIPANQNRIADNLGRFIEVEFPRARAGARKAAGGRFRRAGGRLAVRIRSAPPACRVSSRGSCRRRCRRSSSPACAGSSRSACSTRSRR